MRGVDSVRATEEVKLMGFEDKAAKQERGRGMTNMQGLVLAEGGCHSL